MESPWLHYEAYAVKVINNVIHDTEGAGLGVNGGYQILMAYNTLYRVGARSHLLEAVFGLRTCDGNIDACTQRNQLGGWGGSIIGYDGEQPIPNRDVFIVNNLIVNPAGYRSGWQHFALYGPRTPGAGSNIPNPAHTDDNLQIRGNVIWNGPADWPLGVGEDSGCQPANPTCNAAQLVADNAINSVQPIFVDAAGGNFRVSNAQVLPAPVAIPPFPAWNEFTPAVPALSLGNDVPVDRDGRARAGYDQVGAYALPGAPLPGDDPTITPTATTPANQTVPSRTSYLPLLSGQRAQSATVTPTATPTATATNTPSPTPTATDQNGTIPSGPLTLVTLGDSLTEGERDDSAQGGGYPRRLLEAVQSQRPGSTMLNLGRSGWTSRDLINGVNGDLGQLGQAVAHLNNATGAKIALIWIGSNDLWYLYEFGPEPMTDSAEAQNLAEYEQNLTATVQQLRATGAVVLLGLMDDQSLRPVVADPPNPGEPAFPSISAADRTHMSAQVGRYNSVLSTLAADPSVDVVDFFNTTLFTNPATLADDGNHPNAAGYDAITALWLEKVIGD
jgi:lysophospholipase L1-like esterase